MAWQFGWLRPTRARRIGRAGGSLGLPLVFPQSQPPGTPCRASPNNLASHGHHLIAGRGTDNSFLGWLDLATSFADADARRVSPGMCLHLLGNGPTFGGYCRREGHAVSGSPSPRIRQQGPPAAPPQTNGRPPDVLSIGLAQPLPPTPSFQGGGPPDVSSIGPA